MSSSSSALAGPIVDEAAKAEALIAEGKGVDAVIAMDTAVAKLWDQLPLTFMEAMFVQTRPTAYGVYDRRASSLFKPGEDMIVYMEMAGYEYGRDGDFFVIDMTADVDVKTAAGKRLGGQKDFVKLGLRSRIPNREFFGVVVYQFEGLAKGEYVATTTIKDKQSGDEAVFDLPFQIQ
ncbi:MAG: hypothetical protein GY948_17035 [Alphaproteobacteria bacterium]|nr:hypothetical protein [Alphaproteobacteria bacterium]